MTSTNVVKRSAGTLAILVGLVAGGFALASASNTPSAPADPAVPVDGQFGIAFGRVRADRQTALGACRGFDVAFHAGLRV